MPPLSTTCHSVEVDIWKDEHATGIIDRARPQILHARNVPVADPHDLIAMNLRADRIQDDYDISDILKHTPIDDERVRSAVDDDGFAHYLSIKKRIGMA